ncbi:MAG: PSD1 and planctomycete cytochrome C domain-containing protein [Planctomycetota bacterium]
MLLIALRQLHSSPQALRSTPPSTHSRRTPRYASLILAIGLTLIISAGWRSSSQSAQADDAAQNLQWFESKVRPALLTHCAECHGAEQQEGKLRLDRPEAIAQGGKSGGLLVPGKPAESLLLIAVSHQDANLRMPPEKKLPPEVIADLTEWIKRGASLPGVTAAAARPRGVVDDARIAEGRQFWSLRPRLALTPRDAAVRQPHWAQTPLDLFVLEKLESAQVEPVEAADQVTLLRRVTFDLTGLPPRPSDVVEALTNQEPDFLARQVDRLLASPRYGERWARHWLDVARYADSNGLDENVAFGNAWRYRDYVVRAFNRDKPYDEFVREQLAGDLLPATDDWEAANERLVATGFLGLGPKVLAEVDGQKMEMDIVDEQVDTFGRALLGLTFGCARCHDHKFDPLGTRDYYALAGIFKSTRTMEHFTKVARWYENEIPSPEQLERRSAHQAQIAARKQAIAQFVEEKLANNKLNNDQLNDDKLNKEKRTEDKLPEADKKELKRLRDELSALEKAAPEIPTALGAAEGKVTDVAVHVRGNHLNLGAVVPRAIPRVLDLGAPATSSNLSTSVLMPTDRSGRLELANWLVDPQHPLTSRVLVNRLWRWHFGQGIVASPDNFGELGERPVNPRLLDWLAQDFVDRAWSIKAWQRSLVLSATYQVSSQLHSPASLQLAAADPENRWHGRASLRRLEAEAVRDALLAAGDSLDQTMGGSLLHVKNRDYLFDHTSKDGTKYDSPRRSLYLPVIRNNLYDVFQLFDYTDAAVLNGHRETTTIAPQALFMMNSSLVQQAARSLVEVVQREAGDSPEARIKAIYVRALGRAATAEELRLAGEFLADSPSQKSAHNESASSAWVWLVQSILAANEFIYVR